MRTWVHALRSLGRHPFFSALAVGALALAIGGATLLVSLYDSLVLRTLPVPRPGELALVQVMVSDGSGGSASIGQLSLADAEELRDAARPMARLAGHAAGEAHLRAGAEARRTEVQWVDPDFFAVLGIGAAQGRVFGPSDDPRRGGGGGVVLSDREWTTHFDRDPAVVGRHIALDGEPKTVLGVAPPGFAGVRVGTSPALFALAAEAPEDWAVFRLVGRLEPGRSGSELEALLGGVHAALRARQPGRQSFTLVNGAMVPAEERIAVLPGARGESHLRGEPSEALLLLAGMFVLVLLVLGANLANLMAVRALRERGAAAIRRALGATRWGLAAGWLAESTLLAVAGAVLGTALAFAAAGSLLALPWLPSWVQGLPFALDARVAAIAAALALLTALVVGGVAALEQSRAPAARLREDSRTATTSRSAGRWRDGLIAMQVALSVVLLVVTGLFVRSVGHLMSIDTGLPLASVLTFQVDLPPAAAERGSGTLERLRQELARLPGVADASFSGNPLLGGVRAFVLAQIEGYTPQPGEMPMLNAVPAGPRFLETVGLRVTGAERPRGGAADAASERLAYVNREFARRYGAGREILGRRLRFGMGPAAWDEPREGDLTIAGIVDDRVTSDVREEPAPRIYTPSQASSTTATFYVRTLADPQPLRPMVERAARRVAPLAALGPLRTLEQQRDRSLSGAIMIRDLATGFGAAAATLAGLGLFAVLSYTVRSRRRELGLRQALGARPGDVVRRLLLDGLRPLLIGLTVGLAAAAAGARLAESQVFGVSTRDPLAFGGAALAMLAVGVAAALPAARRALRVEPAEALRVE